MRIWQALVMAIGFSAGVYLLIGRVSLPPRDVNEGLVWISLICAFFVAVSPQTVGGRYLVRGLFVLAMGVLLLWSIRQTAFTPPHYRNLIAFFCLALGVWSIVERAATRMTLMAVLAMGSLAATFASLLFVLKGSASMSQVATCLSVQLGALSLLAFVFPRRLDAFAVLPFVSVLPVMMMAGGHFYLNINPWYMVYLSLPYLLLWIRRGLSFVPDHPILETLALSIMAAGPLGYFIWTVYESTGPLY